MLQKQTDDCYDKLKYKQDTKRFIIINGIFWRIFTSNDIHIELWRMNNSIALIFLVSHASVARRHIPNVL
jgi:hypothetical protein